MQPFFSPSCNIYQHYLKRKERKIWRSNSLRVHTSSFIKCFAPFQVASHINYVSGFRYRPRSRQALGDGASKICWWRLFLEWEGRDCQIGAEMNSLIDWHDWLLAREIWHKLKFRWARGSRLPEHCSRWNSAFAFPLFVNFRATQEKWVWSWTKRESFYRNSEELAVWVES